MGVEKERIEFKKKNKYFSLGLGTESINAWANDLKSLFVLLIRQYDNNLQAIDYLHDLIVANHMIISLFDNLKDCWDFSNSITAHIKK